MPITIDQFFANSNKAITLMGMSGVGKTYISNLLERYNWYHFSADYRIGSKYLNAEIEAELRQKVSIVSCLKALIDNNSISISNNVNINNLHSVANFLGKVGNPEKQGLPLEEFMRRQQLYIDAEIASGYDVPKWITKKQGEGYNKFLNDATGSLCEIDDLNLFEILSVNTLILYIKASENYEKELIERAMANPKPMFYRKDFLLQQLMQYQTENSLDYIAQIDPDDFIRWVFTNLFHTRLPRYQQIADTYGYIIQADDMRKVTSEGEFYELIEACSNQGKR